MFRWPVGVDMWRRSCRLEVRIWRRVHEKIRRISNLLKSSKFKHCRIRMQISSYPWSYAVYMCVCLLLRVLYRIRLERATSRTWACCLICVQVTVVSSVWCWRIINHCRTYTGVVPRPRMNCLPTYTLDYGLCLTLSVRLSVFLSVSLSIYYHIILHTSSLNDVIFWVTDQQSSNNHCSKAFTTSKGFSDALLQHPCIGAATYLENLGKLERILGGPGKCPPIREMWRKM